METVYVVIRRGLVDGIYTDSHMDIEAEIIDLDSDCREEEEQHLMEGFAESLETNKQYRSI